VNGTIADVLNTMRGNAVTKGIDLSSELPDGLQATYADPTRLRQILIILIDNAIKFTPRGVGSRSKFSHGKKTRSSCVLEYQIPDLESNRKRLKEFLNASTKHRTTTGP